MGAENAVLGGAVIASAVDDTFLEWNTPGMGRRFQARSSSQICRQRPCEEVVKNNASFASFLSSKNQGFGLISVVKKMTMEIVMSYDPNDGAMDDMYERISDELYPEQKTQAIGEFTAERLRSFYVDNPGVMRPAVEALLEAQRLQDDGHFAAAVVFAVSSTELLLKAAILTPVVHGLVHIESLADVVVENTLSGPGYTRYAKLLARLFAEFVGIDIHSLRRPESTAKLLAECDAQRGLRNRIVHSGASATEAQARTGAAIATAVFNQIVDPMLHQLGLSVVDGGQIHLRQYGN